MSALLAAPHIDVNAKTKFGWSATHTASKRGFAPIVAELLMAGACRFQVRRAISTFPIMFPFYGVVSVPRVYSPYHRNRRIRKILEMLVNLMKVCCHNGGVALPAQPHGRAQASTGTCCHQVSQRRVCVRGRLLVRHTPPPTHTHTPFLFFKSRENLLFKMFECGLHPAHSGPECKTRLHTPKAVTYHEQYHTL